MRLVQAINCLHCKGTRKKKKNNINTYSEPVWTTKIPALPTSKDSPRPPQYPQKSTCVLTPEGQQLLY